MNKINVAYHLPSLDTIYANRPIYFGYKNAFLDLGYNFFTFTASDSLEKFLEENSIHLFITSSHYYYQKYLDLNTLMRYRKKGMFLLTKIDFWNQPMSSLRINEAKGMSQELEKIKQIKNGLLGDAFFHVVEQGDERMDGFEKETGYKYFTIPLAADKMLPAAKFSEEFKTDISFLGTYLPEKRDFIKKYVFPLGKTYKLKLYGRDWTFTDRILNFIMKVGQYYNVPYLKSFKKFKPTLEGERDLHFSSTIALNIHEDYQKKYGGDCNERTFKIPLSGGFEITDSVECIKKYFIKDKEMVIIDNMDDWFDTIYFYLKNPEKRISIINAGRARVLKDHTYHNRVMQMIDLYEEFKHKKSVKNAK